MHRKRTKRVLLVAGVAAGLAAAGVGAYAWRQHRLDADAADARELGRRALASKDWKGALDGFGRWLQRFGDTDATAADYADYAAARREVPLPNGKHVVGAIWSLRKALEREPANAAVREELLQLYLSAGWVVEALEVVDRQLAANPGDGAKLLLKAHLLEAQRRHADALAVVRDLNRRDPARIEAYFTTLRLLGATHASVGEVDAWVGEVVAAHPDDARFELLRAAACTQRQDAAGAKASLDRVLAAHAERRDDVVFTKLLVTELDGAGRFDDARRVLAEAKDAGDVELRREALRRLWYVGRAQDVAELGAAWDADDAESLALRAMATRAAGGDAAPLVARLRAAGASGVAWAAFVERFDPKGTAPEDGPAAVERAKEAVAAVPDSAVLRQALGDAYAGLGETDLALEAWLAAAARAPSWAQPLTRIARTMLVTGREHLAPSFAKAAVVRAPSDVDAVATYVRAAGAAAGSLDRRQLDSLLAAVRTVEQAAPAAADETLPLAVDLLARTDKAAAEQRLRDLVATPGTSVSETTLLRLAEIAHRDALDVEGQILDLCETLHGVTPRLAAARALAASRTGGAQAALTTLDALRKRARDASAVLDWDRARAALLDAVRSPDAGTTWIVLADAHPDDLPSQLGALASPSAAKDRDGTARAIERVRRLTGEDAITWRVARARWLLASPSVTESETAEAAKILNDVARAAPRSTAARLLLARALELLGNVAAAEEQVALAAQSAPDDPSIALEAARLAHRRGRADEVRRQLDRVLASKNASPVDVERAAYLLAAQGDLRRSAEILDPVASGPSARAEDLAILAHVYARLGETQRAIALCEKLLGANDPRLVELTASLYAAAGRPADAAAALKRLDVMRLPPGEADLPRARHAAGTGRADEATALFRKAADAAPDRADAWRGLLVHALPVGDAATVTAVLDDPRSASAPAAQFLGAARDVLPAALADPRLRALLLEGIDDTLHRDALVEAARTVASAKDPSQRTAAADAVAARAEALPGCLSLQLLAADLTASAGDPRRGGEIARRAVAAFPRSATAARLATELLASGGRWQEALAAARAWRERAPAGDPTPDLAVAEASLRLGRPADALASLEGRVAAAAETPERHSRLLLAHALALHASGDAAGADSVLDAAAAKAPRLRALGLEGDPAALPDGASAHAWLTRAAERLDAADGRTAARLARSWAAAWKRHRTPELLAAAQAQVAKATAAADAPADAWFVRGSLAQEQGDLDAARAAYAEALRRDPASVPARNNLAMVLADAGRWEDAVAEATRATEAAPGNPHCYDTLAYALRKGRAYDEARACLERALKLDPANPEWTVSLAETLAESDDLDGARRHLARVDALAADGGGALPSPLAARVARLRETVAAR